MRAGLIAVGLLLGASAISGQAIASPSAARAPSCPYGKVCLWSAANFQGSKLIVNPVPSGQCRKIADIDGGWSSIYNRTHKYSRVWQSTSESPSDGTRCEGDDQLIRPRAAIKQISIGSAEGLGGF